MSEIFVIAHHGCVGTFNNKIIKYLDTPIDIASLRSVDTYTQSVLYELPIGIVPHNTILIYFNKYGTKSSSTDSLIFMKEIYLKNKYLFNYIINPENYKHNLDAFQKASYRHKDFFMNPIHGLYSKYNPLTYIDMYVPGMICNNQYINYSEEKDEKKEKNHGIYNFFDSMMINVGMKPHKGNFSTTFQNISEISLKNKDTMNIIFIFVCRLPELTDVQFGLMPTLNPIEDIIPYGTDIKDYFSENKGEKVYKLLYKSINEISENDQKDLKRTMPNIIIFPKMEISPKVQIIQLTPGKSANNRLLLLKFIKYTLSNFDTFMNYYNGIIDIDMTSIIHIDKTKLFQLSSSEEMVMFISNNLIQPIFILYNNIIKFNDTITQQFLIKHAINNEVSYNYTDNIDHIHLLISNISAFKENLQLTRIDFKHYSEHESELIKYFQRLIRQDKPDPSDESARKKIKIRHAGGYIYKKYKKYNKKCDALLSNIFTNIHI